MNLEKNGQLLRLTRLVLGLATIGCNATSTVGVEPGDAATAPDAPSPLVTPVQESVDARKGPPDSADVGVVQAALPDAGPPDAANTLAHADARGAAAETGPDACVTSTVVLTTAGDSGDDATVLSRPDALGKNYGSTTQLAVQAWTWEGIEGVHRSFLRFDLAAVNDAPTIERAILTLTAQPGEADPPYYPGHDALTGSNDGWLLRVLAPWQEQQITWLNQPMTTTIPAATPAARDAVHLPASTSRNQTYQVDVTEMVRAMVAGTVPNHGFMLRLTTEAIYRDLDFLSSESTVPGAAPRLTISRRSCSSP